MGGSDLPLQVAPTPCPREVCPDPSGTIHLGTASLYSSHPARVSHHGILQCHGPVPACPAPPHESHPYAVLKKPGKRRYNKTQITESSETVGVSRETAESDLYTHIYEIPILQNCYRKISILFPLVSVQWYSSCIIAYVLQ